MDPKIVALKSTTFEGRRFTRKQLAEIQKTTRNFSNLSRSELAPTICEHFEWRTANGKNKIQTCLNALEAIELTGTITLPAKITQSTTRTQKKIIWTEKTNSQNIVVSSLDEITPISLEVVTEKNERECWNEFVDRYHYLGYRRPIGSYLRYYIKDQHGRKLGCLLFSFATTTSPARSEFRFTAISCNPDAASVPATVPEP